MAFQKQHGFSFVNPCSAINLPFLDQLTKRLDEGQWFDVCYMDLNKASGSFNHDHMNHKMNILGVAGGLVLG